MRIVRAYKSAQHMEVIQKKMYEVPSTTVVEVKMERGILTLSGNGVSLSGAGVNESDADDNGSIW